MLNIHISQIDIYRRPRVPPGFHKQLPAFTSLPSPSPSKSIAPPTLAYIVVGPRVRGKFDVEKAELLGVPPGRQRGMLTKGKSITFKVKVGDEMIERTVRPEECVGPSETPGVSRTMHRAIFRVVTFTLQTVLILDIPTPAHISSLVSAFENSPFYSKFRSTKPEDLKEYAVRSVFHICGNDVLENERYIAFMNGFASGAHVCTF